MRTAQIAVYTFDELSAPAQDKARDWYRTISASDTDWDDVVRHDVYEIAKRLGIHTSWKQIHYSGFSAQGDGAQFEGELRMRGRHSTGLTSATTATRSITRPATWPWWRTPSPRN